MLAYRRPPNRIASLRARLCVALTCGFLLTLGCDATIGPPAGTGGPVDAAEEPAIDAPPAPPADAAPQPGVDATAIAQDAAPVADAAERVPCATTYESVDGFLLCTEAADECRFNANTPNTTCREVCESKGGECITAEDNDNDDLCRENGDQGCEVDNNDNQICVCTRLE